MNAWELPTSLLIGGVGFAIRSDYRAILDILRILADPEYEEDEKALILLRILYPDWERIPPERLQEAIDRGREFIDAGFRDDGAPHPRVMDWEKDGAVIIPAINRVTGREIRALDYMHWWTFLGAYTEIGESLFASILAVRQKKARGKPLEKQEQEFYRANKRLIDLEPNYTEDERAEQERLKALFD